MDKQKKNRRTITRKRIFEIIQIGKDTDAVSRAFDFTVVGLIILNIIISLCFTYEELIQYNSLFHIIEFFTIICFTVEYALRLWTADFLYHKSRGVSIIQYIFSFNGIVEILSIIPFFLPMVFPKGIVAFRMFRVVRILRLFQANAYSDSLSTIMIVLKRKRSQLLSSMLIIFVIMIMASLIMYGFEHETQPDVFKNAFSGIWWSTSTLLTVGYGDIYPVTTFGKIAGIFITFLGVGMAAIPTGILSAGFIEYTSEQRDEKSLQNNDFCPHCGKRIR